MGRTRCRHPGLTIDNFASGGRRIDLETLTPLVAAIVFGVVNAIVRPLLLLFSLPFIIVTLGLFVFIVNGLTLWLVGALVPGFHVDGLWAGVVGSILLGIVSWIISAFGLRAGSEV